MVYASDVHNLLQAKIILAEKRCQSAVLAYKADQLQLNIAHEQLRTIEDVMSSCVNTVLDQLAAARIISDDRGERWYTPDDAKLECPWLKPS
jgi:hypothetical protein